MSAYQRSYKMPNGDVTRNVDTYLAAWDALSAKVTRFFPGYEEVARNPSIRFVKYGINGLGVRVVVDSFDLSPTAIEALTAPDEEKP